MDCSTYSQAATYEENSSKQKADGIGLMDLLDIREGSKVLDLGCGTGNLTKILAERVGAEGKVVGIDPDSQRIQIAREKYSSGNLEFLERGGEDIPGDGYDTVFSNHVLHWCKDKDLIFQQVAKCLKQDGQFAFTTTADFDPAEVLYSPANMFSTECRKTMMDAIHIISSYELLQLASANNFSLEYFKKDSCKLRYDSVKELIEVFYLTPYKGRFDPSSFNVEAMTKHYGGGEVFVMIPRLMVILRRLYT